MGIASPADEPLSSSMARTGSVVRPLRSMMTSLTFFGSAFYKKFAGSIEEPGGDGAQPGRGSDLAGKE